MQTYTHARTDYRTLTLQRKSLCRRIHFWAALIASPFALLAALTGLLYVFTPQIEAVLYAQLDRVPVTGAPLSLDATVAAAQAVAPAGWQLKSVQPPAQPGHTVQMNFGQTPDSSGHASHEHEAMELISGAESTTDQPVSDLVIYVNPYTGSVTGQLPVEQRFNIRARKLHSRLLQNDNWRWMIELAASWLMVMLLTGIYVWWPQTSRQIVPRAELKGRAAWRQWHGFIGAALASLSFVILTTGLTWSQYAGSQIRALRDSIGQAPPAVPANLHSSLQPGITPASWQEVWDFGLHNAPAVAMSLTPPVGEQGVWLLSATDRSQPHSRFDLAIDAYSRTPLYYSGWDDQTAFAKATAIGIPFHRGEFGVWNQALLFLFGTGILFSLISGWVMFFRRLRAGNSGMPQLLPGAWTSFPLVWLPLAALMCIAMPLLAVSAAAVIMIEATLLRRVAPPA